LPFALPADFEKQVLKGRMADAGKTQSADMEEIVKS